MSMVSLPRPAMLGVGACAVLLSSLVGGVTTLGTQPAASDSGPAARLVRVRALGAKPKQGTSLNIDDGFVRLGAMTWEMRGDTSACLRPVDILAGPEEGDTAVVGTARVGRRILFRFDYEPPADIGQFVVQLRCRDRNDLAHDQIGAQNSIYFADTPIPSGPPPTTGPEATDDPVATPPPTVEPYDQVNLSTAEGCLGEPAYATLLLLVLGDPSSPFPAGPLALGRDPLSAAVDSLATELDHFTVDGPGSDAIADLVAALHAHNGAAAFTAITALRETDDPAALLAPCGASLVAGPGIAEGPPTVPIDPCGLLTLAEVETVTGTAPDRPIGLEDGDACGYAADDTHRLAWHVLPMQGQSSDAFSALAGGQPVSGLGGTATWFPWGTLSPDGAELAVVADGTEVLIELTVPRGTDDGATLTLARPLAEALLSRAAVAAKATPR